MTPFIEELLKRYNIKIMTPMHQHDYHKVIVPLKDLEELVSDLAVAHMKTEENKLSERQIDRILSIIK